MRLDEQVERVVGRDLARAPRRDDGHAEVLVRQIVDGGRGRAGLDHLMAPSGAPQDGIVRRRLEDFLLQAFFAHESRHQRQAVSALRRDAVLEAALARPLRHAAREVDRAPAHLPAPVL